MPQQSTAHRRSRRARHAVLLAASGLLLPLVAAPAASAATGAPVTVDVLSIVDGKAKVSTRTASTPAKAEQLIDRLEADPTVAAADVSTRYALSAFSPTGTPGVKAGTACITTGTDPYYNCAVHLPAINAPAAWSTTGGAGTTVAVLDSGVDATAPDLAGKVITGPNYAPGTDLGEHGTWVSTVIAGIRGNSYGAVGVAPDTKILSIRVCSDSCDSQAIAKGIVTAADAGVTVINMSLGGENPSSVMQQAVNYALGKGVVVVASAGNSGNKGNPVEYPAAFPGVISVAATNSSGTTAAAWSQHNTAVDLSAPGESVAAGGPAANDYLYEPVNGTSFSAPMVSAAAALVRAVNSSLTPAQVETLLENTATRPSGWPTSGYGTGVLNVASAVTGATAGVPSSAPVTITKKPRAVKRTPVLK